MCLLLPRANICDGMYMSACNMIAFKSLDAEFVILNNFIHHKSGSNEYKDKQT